MRLSLLSHSLRTGGAERVLVSLAGGLARRGHAVCVLTLAPAREDAFALDPAVARQVVGFAERAAHPWQAPGRHVARLRALREALSASRPDRIIAFTPPMNLMALLASPAGGVPVIVTEHAPLHRQSTPPWMARLRRQLYRRAAGVVSVSRGVDAGLDFVPAARRAVVPNCLPPVGDEGLVRLARPGERYVVAMGRLVREKGFDRLLRAFGRVAAEHADWRLCILGDGPERPRLEALAAALRIAGRVELPGAAHPPQATLRAASESGGIFVLSSRYEGFGNVLVEALAAGLPALAFDCPTGPREILEGAGGGRLLLDGDIAALASALAEWMDDEDGRARFAAQAALSAAPYAVETVVARWEQLLQRFGADR